MWGRYTWRTTLGQHPCQGWKQWAVRCRTQDKIGRQCMWSSRRCRGPVSISPWATWSGYLAWTCRRGSNWHTQLHWPRCQGCLPNIITIRNVNLTLSWIIFWWIAITDDISIITCQICHFYQSSKTKTITYHENYKSASFNLLCMQDLIHVQSILLLLCSSD